MIHDASAWPQAEKDAAIDWVFDHPHPFTAEDFEYSAQVFGADKAACREVFRTAPKLAVMIKDGVPLYIFCVCPRSVVSTVSEQRLDANLWFMTKHLVRFGKSQAGAEFFKDSIGFAEESDLLNGSVRHRWLVAIGFKPYDRAELNGQRFTCYSYQGG